NWPDTEDAHLAQAYAVDVFSALARGESRVLADGTVTLAATPTDFERHLLFASKQSYLTPDYPSAKWNPSPNYSAGHGAYDFVVIHTVQGSYAGCISWFKNTASKVSAHYVIRSSDGEITQMVEHKNTAWHAGCYNGRSIGIEHEGYVSDPAWYTEAMYQSSAKLTRWIADKHGIPRDRAHIIGHVEVSPTCNANRHTDPGPHWNWTKYMNLVNGTTASPTTGVLKGAIYKDPDTNARINGATVKVTGTNVNQTVKVGADGLYTFTLPKGTYTVEASASGYSNGSVIRTLVGGDTVWGSIGLKAAAADPGVMRGKIWIEEAGKDAATGTPIAGATVKLSNGQSVVTGADGWYVFSVPAGTYTATATASGYQTGSATRTVTSGATIYGSIGLAPAASSDQKPPVLTIDSPDPGAPLASRTFTLSRVQLRGSATDETTALKQVKYALNGRYVADKTLSNGRFDFEAKLAPGQNTLEISATDAASNTGKATVVLFFDSGVDGFVHLAGEEEARVSGARVALLESLPSG
ncbi:MAG: N-acetylmuramoyl-L-alanine amidase, partial [Myxococcales bacterium]